MQDTIKRVNMKQEEIFSPFGAKGDNELPQLLELFTKYRKEKNLWN